MFYNYVALWIRPPCHLGDDRRSLNYLVTFDQEAGMFLARSPANPQITGEGPSLYAAIDNLEVELSQNTRRSEKLNMDLVIREKESEVEVTAKISILA